MKLNGAEQKRLCSILGRPPTLTEETIFAIQWSEHCSYKSSKRFLKTLPSDSPFVILGPGQDSGIVAITHSTRSARSGQADPQKGKRWGIVISHESHNHPSQIVPYEGAATGIGGVVRDVLCMGARVIGCLDILRFGDGQTELSRTIIRDVVRGIGGYGNPIGIPNLGGSTLFDRRYNKNCLVNAVAIGLVREDHVIPSIVPTEAGHSGYDIILVGKATDASGFGGAAFASASLLEDEEDQNRSAVQEPNPFLEQHLLAAFYDLFEWLQQKKYVHKVSCKDLGAGGVVCATVEQVAARGLGAEIELTNVHTIPDPPPPEVIACAETQERMCLISHPDLTPHILKHFNETWELPRIAENARASVIGKVTDNGVYRLTFKGEVVCEAKSTTITQPPHPNPLPQEGEGTRTLSHPLSLPKGEGQGEGLKEDFLRLLDNPNHASKEPIFIHFDKSVIGNTMLEPGEADATVIAPLQDQNDWTGVALGCSGPLHEDPYVQGFRAVLESAKKVIAVGATPRALTDCLNYGNPEDPHQLWQLQEGIRGLRDAASILDIPFISGNVSLYNCTDDGSSIPPTATVCCIGVLSDARTALSMHLKKNHSHIALVRDDDLARLLTIFPTMIQKNHILSAHTIVSGLLMSLLEMTTGERGCRANIGLDIRCDDRLLSSSSGILIESISPIVHPDILPIGQTVKDPILILKTGTAPDLSLALPPLHEKWKNGIPKAIFAAK